MKKTLLVAAAAVAALSLPALAQAQDGNVSASYIYSDDLDANAIGIGGAVTTEVGAVKLQFNVDHVRGEDTFGDNASATSLVAHAYKQTDQYAFGGFLTAGDSSVSYGSYGIGIGGSYYLDNLSLGGVVSYTTTDNNSGSASVYGINARYFFSDNFAVGATIDRAEPNGNADAFNIYGVEAEFKSASPLSFFGAYRNVDDGAFDTDVFSVGARYSFGNKSLKEQERSGAKAMRVNSSAF